VDFLFVMIGTKKDSSTTKHMKIEIHPFSGQYYGKSSWRGRCFKEQDQWDTNCIFTELAGFYTLETDQDKLTVGSVGSGQVPGSWIIGGKFSNSKYLIFPKKKRQAVCRCHNIPDRKGRTKEGRLWYPITINKRVIIKETVNEGLMALIPKGY